MNWKFLIVVSASGGRLFDTFFIWRLQVSEAVYINIYIYARRHAVNLNQKRLQLYKHINLILFICSYFNVFGKTFCMILCGSNATHNLKSRLQNFTQLWPLTRPIIASNASNANARSGSKLSSHDYHTNISSPVILHCCGVSVIGLADSGCPCPWAQHEL